LPIFKKFKSEYGMGTFRPTLVPYEKFVFKIFKMWKNSKF